MVRNRFITVVVLLILAGCSLTAEARLDEAGLEQLRSFVAQGRGGLSYEGIMVKSQDVAGPAERDEERFRRSRKMLQGEVQLWNSRIQIMTAWPQDQALRAAGDSFLEIVDLGRFYHQLNSRNTTRAEAVRRLATAESDAILNFIRGMSEFEQRLYGDADDGLKNACASMKRIAIVNLQEILRFADHRSNRALLNLYNENRHAYLNRQESRHASPYLDAVNDLIDFERATGINFPDVAPATVAKGIASYDEKIRAARELLVPYLQEQRKLGNNDHVRRLEASFEILVDDFENSKEGFKSKFPSVSRREGL